VNTVYEIGPFRLDATVGVLTRGGVPIAIGSRAVAVLTALVRRPNEYVQKDSIIAAAWPDVVVEEANLTVQISAIRRALAQAPGGERWLETLSRRGYRFVGPVTELMSKGTNSNLPEAVTSFVGRERELVELKQLLPRTRLITLVGVGGIGKTRLALQVAAEVLDAYRDGVWLVELASVADPGLLPQTVAMVLGLKEQPDKSLTQSVTEHLASRHLLLVLDNAEHLIGACALLADVVLRQCPHIVMLITSREKLGTLGEQTYPVPALSMPDRERDATAESLARYESARLFVERVRLNLPHFAVTNDNASALASVCCRLDGIPLAIELAAARVRSMSVEEVDRRLDQRFRLLTGGSVTAPRRHQTLRALIDWSYDLLADGEKALLGRVSVFAGGWTLEAAEQTCVGDGIEDWEVLDLVTSLADKSLVVAEERNGVARYRLLETVCQYARKRLQETDEEACWRRRHLAYFLALAEKAEPHLIDADQQAWLDRLEREHDNLRAALEWSAANESDANDGLRLAGTLYKFWITRCYLSEGRGCISKLLASAPRRQTAPARAKALQAAGSLAWLQSDYPAAVAQHEEALACCLELKDRLGAAESLNSLGRCAMERGEYASARALHEESLAIRRELGDRRGIAHSLKNLGNVAADLGDFPAAKTHYQDSLEIFRELSDGANIGDMLTNLGRVAHRQQNYSTARELAEESFALWHELGDRAGIGVSLNNLATVAFAQGDYASARAKHQESLKILREIGNRQGIATSLEGLAGVESALGRSTRAARFWGAAGRLREEIGCPLAPWERPRHDRQVAATRAASGDDTAFDLAWQEGRAMMLAQAIEHALEKT
jgi:non-specific serine/threonine protein kinase